MARPTRRSTCIWPSASLPGLLGAVGEGRIEPEELRDGDTDRGKSKGGAEPGEKCPFFEHKRGELVAFRPWSEQTTRGILLTQRKMVPGHASLVLELD